MEKLKNFLSGMKDYVKKSYMESWFFNNWDRLVLMLILFVAIPIFIRLLAIATPFIGGLLTYRLIKLLIYVVKY